MPRQMGFRRMGGELTIHYVHWDGTLDIIRVPAGVQRIVQIPAFGFFSMTVRADRRSPAARSAAAAITVCVRACAATACCPRRSRAHLLLPTAHVRAH